MGACRLLCSAHARGAATSYHLRGALLCPARTGEVLPPITHENFLTQPARGEGLPPIAHGGSCYARPVRGEVLPPITHEETFLAQPARGEGLSPIAHGGSCYARPMRGEVLPPITHEETFLAQPVRGEGLPPIAHEGYCLVGVHHVPCACIYITQGGSKGSLHGLRGQPGGELEKYNIRGGHTTAFTPATAVLRPTHSTSLG